MCINRDQIEPISVVNSNSIVVSVVFKDLNVWSENSITLNTVIRHLLRLFVVHSDCIVDLKHLRKNQSFNVDYILVHKTDCGNNGARVTSKTSIMVIKSMSTIQFFHAEIGLEVKPFFGMEPQISHLKKIVMAAKNGCSPLCNMVIIMLIEKVKY